MRRLTVALLTFGLVWMGVGSAMAQSPSASPEPAGQQVELPEAGLAITLPEDWDIWTDQAEPELGFIVITGPERFGPDVGMEPILAARPEGQAPGPSPDACTLTLYRPITLTAHEFMNELYGGADGIVIESMNEATSRVLYRPWSSDNRQLGFYAIGGENRVALLWCWAVEPPEDYWLSISESLEWLAHEE